jgi:protein SCO1/2
MRVFLVSVDPDRDKPENLRIYLNNFDDEFQGLTGEIDQIYKFSTQVNAPFFPVVNSKEPNYTVDHSGSLVVINPEAQYAGFFRAPHDTNKISKALASLLN